MTAAPPTLSVRCAATHSGSRWQNARLRKTPPLNDETRDCSGPLDERYGDRDGTYQQSTFRDVRPSWYSTFHWFRVRRRDAGTTTPGEGKAPPRREDCNLEMPEGTARANDDGDEERRTCRAAVVVVVLLLLL